MDLHERLKKVRTEIALSPDKLAKELTAKGYKITDKTIYGYESDARQPSVSYLESLTVIYDVNPYWVITGNGEMFLNDDNRNDYCIPETLDFNKIVFIPHIDLKVSAGYGTLIDEENMTKDFMAFGKKWLFQNVSAPLEELLLFTVNGDSMDCANSQIKDSSLILTDKSINELRNDGIYVISLNNSLYVKRLQMLPNNMMRVKSDNPLYDPFDVSLEDNSVKIIGKVVWAGSKLDTIK